MVDPEMQGFLQSGCGLLVATVSADGEPHATRGWGLDVLELGPTAPPAANVLTLRSLQLKGRSQGLDAASPGDPERADRYVRQFHADVEVTDRVPWETFERFFPASYVACVVSVREMFDQTPGPGAGARTGSR